MPAAKSHAKATQPEKRQFTRAAVQLNAEIHLDCGMHMEAHTRDISLGGALLSTERYLPRGHPVQLLLDLEFDGEACRMRAKGHVVRVDDDGVAITFTGIHPESLTPLCHVILSHAADPDQVEAEIRKHTLSSTVQMRTALSQ